MAIVIFGYSYPKKRRLTTRIIKYFCCEILKPSPLNKPVILCNLLIINSLPPPYIQEKEGILNTLTNQELKILKLASTDLSNKEIADRLCISDQTAKKHRQNIYEKLNLHGKSEIRKFLRYIDAVFR